MSVENGEWVMKGVSSRHPECIHTVEELEDYIGSIGFLPLFANSVEGFLFLTGDSDDISRRGNRKTKKRK